MITSVNEKYLNALAEHINAAFNSRLQAELEKFRERAAKIALKNGMQSITDPRMPAMVGQDIYDAIRAMKID